MKKYVLWIMMFICAWHISCISVEVKYSEKIKNERIPAVLYVPEMPDFGIVVDMELLPGLAFETAFKKHIIDVFSAMDKKKMRDKIHATCADMLKESNKLNIKTEQKIIDGDVKLVNHPKSNLLKWCLYQLRIPPSSHFFA
jgi:hypothetical protein